MVEFIQDFFYRAFSQAETLEKINFIVSITGFFVTIFTGLWVSKKVKSKIFLIEAVSDAARAHSIIEEIRRLQRLEQWVVVPDRYVELRRLLSGMTVNERDISADDGEIILKAVSQFKIIEDTIEGKLKQGLTEKDAKKANKILSEQADALYKVTQKIKRKVN